MGAYSLFCFEVQFITIDWCSLLVYLTGRHPSGTGVKFYGRAVGQALWVLNVDGSEKKVSTNRTSSPLLFSTGNMADGDHQLFGSFDSAPELSALCFVDSIECVVSLIPLCHKNRLPRISPLVGLKTHLEEASTFSMPGQMRRTYLKMRSS